MANIPDLRKRFALAWSEAKVNGLLATREAPWYQADMLATEALLDIRDSLAGLVVIFRRMEGGER